MNYYRINGKRGYWCAVNQKLAAYIDFNRDHKEIVFDDTLRIKVDERDYRTRGKEIQKKMFKEL